MATRVEPEALACKIEQDETSVVQHAICEVRAGCPLHIVKKAAIHTSMDADSRDPLSDSLAEINDLQDANFSDLFGEHVKSWRHIWQGCRIKTDDTELSRATRFHALHVVQAASLHSTRLDVGFPARGWQEAYHGHAFWDELLVIPFLSTRLPDIARSLLLYRCRRLDEATRTASLPIGTGSAGGFGLSSMTA